MLTEDQLKHLIAAVDAARVRVHAFSDDGAPELTALAHELEQDLYYMQHPTAERNGLVCTKERPGICGCSVCTAERR